MAQVQSPLGQIVGEAICFGEGVVSLVRYRFNLPSRPMSLNPNRFLKTRMARLHERLPSQTSIHAASIELPSHASISSLNHVEAIAD